MLPLSVDLASLTNPRSPATPALRATDGGSEGGGCEVGTQFTFPVVGFPPAPRQPPPSRAATSDSLCSVRAVPSSVRGGSAAPAPA